MFRGSSYSTSAVSVCLTECVILYTETFACREDLWRVVQSLQERLSRIDKAKLICIDFINRILQHLQHIRVTKAAA